MGTVHPPRDKQTHLAKPSLWVAEPTDDSLSLIENAFERMDLHFGMANIPRTLTRLPEGTARLCGLFWFNYRTSSAKNVVQAR